MEDDQQAVRKCLEGEKAAFGFLVEKYKKKAYFTALALVGSHEDALDLSQEAFVRAYRAIGSYNAKYGFFTWFYRILRNLCLNHVRDRSRRGRLLEKRSEELRVSHPPDPSLLVEADEIRGAVWEALASLSPRDREIIVLRDLQELSYREIADTLECPMGTVMSRLYNARKRLREKLERYL